MLMEMTININLETGSSTVISEREVEGDFEVPKLFCDRILDQWRINMETDENEKGVFNCNSD